MLFGNINVVFFSSFTRIKKVHTTKAYYKKQIKNHKKVNNKTTTVRSLLVLNSTYTIHRKIDDEQQPRKWWRHRLFPPTSHKEAPHSHQNCTTVTSLLHKREREKKEKRLRNGISSSVSRLNLETASVRSSLLLPFCSSSSVNGAWLSSLRVESE